MTELETAGAVASIVTTAVATATLIVLTWYTVETQKLRREAQRQNENSMMPLVMFQSVYIQGQHAGASRLVIRNLGPGPAFNVYMDSISLFDKSVAFEHPRTLAPGQEEFVAVSGLGEAKVDSVGQHDDGKIHHTYGLLKALKENMDAMETKGVITYRSALGKKYRTDFTMDHKREDAESFVVFDRMGPV